MSIEEDKNTDGHRLDPSEQAALTEILAKEGNLFPEDLELVDNDQFFLFVREGLKKYRKKFKQWMQMISFGVMQRKISEQGRADFLKRYNLAQQKMTTQRGPQITPDQSNQNV